MNITVPLSCLMAGIGVSGVASVDYGNIRLTGLSQKVIVSVAD